jgi:phospholipid/cholesterol/gamma-HCH transport system substrate-binding protein
MSKMQNRNISVGFFIIGGLLLFGTGMFLIGDRRQAFGQHAEYYAEFKDLAGLANGAQVRVGGLAAGEVIAIGVPDSPSSRFRVKWRINANLRGLVRADSVATVDTEGVVGGTYLSVRAGSVRAIQVPVLATIPSQEPVELSEVLTRGTALLNDAQSMLKDVGGKLGGTLDTVNSTIANVNDIVVGLKQGRGAAGMLLSDDALANEIRQTVNNSTASVDAILGDLKAGRGPAGMLLHDPAVEAQIRESLKNMQQATVDIAHATHQADALISDLSAQQIPQKVGTVVDSLNDTAKQANQMVSEINQPDGQGVTAGTNIRESLMNVNAATLNLADDTEALKHNILLRGFFRKRGYYNLDRILPDQYRHDAAFTSPANHRTWLSVAELFQADSKGKEDLTAGGKALLDSALTQNGDSVPESPIVVEGYSNGSRPTDQLRLSRSRALLVRQYLQSHFQLEASNIGIVGMKSLPPNNTGRASWDGVCIVVIRRDTK